MSRSKVYAVDDTEFRLTILRSKSYSDALTKLGLGANGGSSTLLLKRRIEELGCSIEHYSATYSQATTRHSLEDILVEDSKYSNRRSLKNRLLKEGLLEYKCSHCGNEGEWQGKQLSLQLDHVNGVNNDNRIENLRLLCPNCHSVTETYSGKNRLNKSLV